MKKTITVTLTDKIPAGAPKGQKYVAALLVGDQIATLFRTEDEMYQTFLHKCMSLRYDYGWQKVVGILEGKPASYHCSVVKAKIILEQ